MSQTSSIAAGATPTTPLARQRAGSLRRLMSNQMGREIEVRCSSSGRRELCQSILRGIMNSLVLDHEPDSDLLSSKYETASVLSQSQRTYQVSMLQAFKSALIDKIDTWVKAHDADQATMSNTAAHEHSVAAHLEFDAPAIISIAWPEVSVKMEFVERQSRACTICTESAGEEELEEADSMWVTLLLTRESDKWAVNWHVEHGFDMEEGTVRGLDGDGGSDGSRDQE